MRQKILRALENKALNQQELADSVGVMDDAHEFVEALFHLNQESLVTKHPIMDGCKTCACHVTYKWRLTFAGRKHLQDTLQTNEASS